MRYLSLLIFVITGCTKPNNAVCCATTEQCAEVNIDELRLCGAGQACKDHRCVASECDTSADCTTPENPVCIANVCVGSCSIDDDCAGVSGRPYCDIGVCVGCRDGADCPVTAAFCDQEDRTCRGCTSDAECISGVCIESEGTCNTQSDTIYVRTGGADTGECGFTAPCETLGYALQKVVGTRRVIRILGGNYDPGTVSITKSVILDGSNTSISFYESSPKLSFSNVGSVTIEGINFVGVTSASGPAIAVGTGSLLRLFDAETTLAGIAVNGGGVDIAESRLTTSPLNCTSGAMSIKTSTLVGSTMVMMTCQVTFERNHWDSAAGASFDAIGGLLSIENNVFVERNEFTDLIEAQSTTPGSSIRFNTIVNTSPIIESGVAIYCDGGTDVTSNIVAYNSTNPIDGTCTPNHTVFDTPASGEVGPTDTVADVRAIFADFAMGNYRLAPNSPALAFGVPGLITVDIDGLPRPRPTGSAPDAGAYEAP